MSSFLALLPLWLVIFLCLYGLIDGVDVYSALTRGAKKGLETVYGLLPVLICLFPAIALFSASALPGLFGRLLSPLFSRLGLPEETALIMLLRPFSGSGALSAAGELISAHGADTILQ